MSHLPLKCDEDEAKPKFFQRLEPLPFRQPTSDLWPQVRPPNSILKQCVAIFGEIWSKVDSMKDIRASVDIGGRASGFGASYFFGFWWYSPKSP